MAATDWFNDKPNPGPTRPMGSLPTWQIMDHHMKKELMMEGGLLSSSRMRSMP
jgi:hypothetical protein